MNIAETINLTGTIAVVKIGGSVIETEELLTTLMADVNELVKAGLSLAIVHGGGPAIDQKLAAMKKVPAKIQGLRVTDKETLCVVIDELTLINKLIVEKIAAVNVPSIGYVPQKSTVFATEFIPNNSGIFGGQKLVLQDDTGKNVDLGFVGKINNVNVAKIKEAFHKGAVPVIAPLAVDKDGSILNINADTAALELAAAIGATKLINITDVPGVLQNVAEKKSLIQNLSVEEAEAKIADGTISGGMLPKIKSCIEAVNNGIAAAQIIDGNTEHALLKAFTTQTIGTTISCKTGSDCQIFNKKH